MPVRIPRRWAVSNFGCCPSCSHRHTIIPPPPSSSSLRQSSSNNRPTAGQDVASSSPSSSSIFQPPASAKYWTKLEAGDHNGSKPDVGGSSSSREAAKQPSGQLGHAPVGLGVRPHATMSSNPIVRKVYPVASESRGAAAANHSGRRVHIIGTNPRSLFLAHVLRSTYDSVELVTPSGPSRQYKNIIMDSSDPTAVKRKSPVIPNAAADSIFARRRGEQPSSWSRQERITDLVVAENSIDDLHAIKNRIDGETTICAVQDGLGFVEQARDDIFANSKSPPSFVLGHLPRSYQFDRSAKAVRQMPRNLSRNCFTYLTVPRGQSEAKDKNVARAEAGSQQQQQRTRIDHGSQRLIRRLQDVVSLEATTLPYQNWLRVKLPAVAFSAIVDPICTILDCRYDQVMHNPRGVKLIDQLLREISNVVRSLPELQVFPDLAEAFAGEQIRRYCLGQIRGKGKSPSPMALKVKKGHRTDIGYLNGWFVKAGDKVGVDVGANRFVITMVQAKQAQELQKIDAAVPWEETSRRFL